MSINKNPGFIYCERNSWVKNLCGVTYLRIVFKYSTEVKVIQNTFKMQHIFCMVVDLNQIKMI